MTAKSSLLVLLCAVAVAAIIEYRQNLFYNIKKMENKKLSTTDPKGKLIWLVWSVAMLLILWFSIDRIFEFNLLSFEVFVGIVLFFIIVLQIIVLGWVLYIRNKTIEHNKRLTNAIRKIEKHLEDV
jgi:amino acid transporter